MKTPDLQVHKALQHVVRLWISYFSYFCDTIVRQISAFIYDKMLPDTDLHLKTNFSSVPLWVYVIAFIQLVLDHLVAGDAVLVPDDLHLVEADTL